MRSSSGEYYIGLDHIRAVAVFMVFAWHFIHVRNGHMAGAPIFPLSLMAEGHTGVALFMTLSGYLFAKLLDGKSIQYASFFWNRFVRLVPLLALVIFVVGFQRYLAGVDLVAYAKTVLRGTILPVLPNGAWSITVEFHFYLLLPILLYISGKWKYSLMFVVVAALLFRVYLFDTFGQIQTLSFWTIVGRIDQFLLGMIAYQFRYHILGKSLLAIVTIILFALFFWCFDSLGGFYTNPSYPSPSPIWIYLPTIEGLAYAIVISWYDNSFVHSTGKVSKFIALVGTYSYSIYLLHFFVVFQLSRIVNVHVMNLSNMYLLLAFSFICFWVMIPIGYLSYTFIESPFLKWRTKYIQGRACQGVADEKDAVLRPST